MNAIKKMQHRFALLGMGLTLAFGTIAVWPEDAEARRFGGGSSMGSRGSRSFDAPVRQAQPRQADQPGSFARNSAQPAGAMNRPGLMGGLMGGIGGFMLGGLLGSMLFGGMGGAAGGFGLLDLLLLGGVAYLLFRMWKARQQQRGGVLTAPGGVGPVQRETWQEAPQSGGASRGPLPEQFTTSGVADDPVSQGLRHIAAMDPAFDERRFLDGARSCFEMIQSAWADWKVDHLKPLVTERMWSMVEKQAADGQARGHRNVIERIQFKQTDITEAWQEAGMDYLTVHMQVSLVDYVLDAQNNLVEGSREQPVAVDEYWTFTRPVGSQNPNWHLSALQQPDEVAQSAP
ncbi:MAG: Tim44 domain-containing protein [Magnetococcales bacterium]|nr:Tim44 domain-containing protein [Magnetococcales bacterium]